MLVICSPANSTPSTKHFQLDGSPPHWGLTEGFQTYKLDCTVSWSPHISNILLHFLPLESCKNIPSVSEFCTVTPQILVNTWHEIKYHANIVWATNFCVILSSNANCFPISLVLRVFGMFVMRWRLHGHLVFSIASFTAAMYVMKSSILVAKIKQQSASVSRFMSY